MNCQYSWPNFFTPECDTRYVLYFFSSCYLITNLSCEDLYIYRYAFELLTQKKEEKKRSSLKYEIASADKVASCIFWTKGAAT